MSKLLTYIMLLFVVTPVATVSAQTFTGSWEGIMDDEYLQVNIEQRGNELCGFSYDYVLRNSRDYCRAMFTGNYDPEKDALFISGTQFLENSGGHVFMRMKLWREEGDPKNVLHALVVAKGVLGFLGQAADEVILKRVSARPEKNGLMAPCFPKSIKRKTAVPKRKTTVLPGTIPPDKRDIKRIPKQDTAGMKKTGTVVPVPIQKDTVGFSTLSKRKQTEQGRITVTTNKISLKLYDNGVVDNDTVSVYYNGRLLVSHQRLSEKPVELDLQLDENTDRHEITLFAENLGGIPPNTALIVITAGSKRYELRSKASLEENAVLIFEYKKE